MGQRANLEYVSHAAQEREQVSMYMYIYMYIYAEQIVRFPKDNT